MERTEPSNDRVFRAVSKSLPSILLTSVTCWVLAATGTCIAASSAEPIVVSAGLDRSRIYADQEAVLDVAVDYPGDGRRIILEAPLLPVHEGIRIENRTVLTETRWEPSGVRTSIHHRLTLVPEREGTTAFDSLRVAWIDPATGRGGSSVVSAGELRVVSRPPVIGTLVRHPRRSLAGLGFAAVGIGVLVWLLVRPRRAREPEAEWGPAERLENEWRRLRILARQGALGPFSDTSSRAVRRFVRDAYGVEADRLPTPAVIAGLEARNTPSGEVGAVERVLTFTDDMRFGLWVPTHPELEGVLREVEQLWAAGRATELSS